MKTIGEVKDSVAGLLSGTNVDKITGISDVFERAARKLVQKADVPEASQKIGITLYDGVFDYEAPEKIFGSAIIDIRPQGVTRWFGDDVTKVPVDLFDRTKGQLPGGCRVAFEYRDGTPIIRIDSNKAFYRANIDNMSETADWTESGTVANFGRDAVSYYDTPASLRFTLNGAGTGILTKTIPQMDLSAYENIGVAFLAMRLPSNATATDLSSIELRLGSDDTNYEAITATEGFLGAWVVGEWLLVALDTSTSVTTGTPDWTAMDYVQLRFTHGATITNMNIGGLWLALPVPHEILFQTAAIFMNNGVRSCCVTDDTDIVILNDAALLLYEHECALGAALQQNMDKKASTLRAVLYGGEGDAGLYAQYRGDNPSNELRTVGTYYQM